MLEPLRRCGRPGRRSTIATSIVAGALAIALLPGCSYMSTRGRQEMAYSRYVQKHSHKRVKQQAKFKKWKMPLTPPSQATVTSGTNEGPQSASSRSPN